MFNLHMIILRKQSNTNPDPSTFHSINNLGDPWVESNYGVHSREFEIGILDWFAKLWDIEKEEMWGYVTNCGKTFFINQFFLIFLLFFIS